MNYSVFMVGTVLSSMTVMPQKAVLNLHYLDRNYAPSTACAGGSLLVAGPRFVEKGFNQEGKAASADERDPKKGDGLSKKENKFCITATELAQERQWAKSVYRTHVATGTKNEGTSFLVGRNIILTNNHIAVPLPANPQDCRAVQVLTRTATPQWVDCKRILYCNASRDFCFVEMKQVAPGIELGDLSPPFKLKIAAPSNEIAYLIGNSGALGIQGSKGAVLNDPKLNSAGKLISGKFIHYIAMIGGASGSPIINLKGEVIGINHSHSAFDGKHNDYVDPSGDTFNIATSTNYIYDDVKNSSYFASFTQAIDIDSWLKITSAFVQ